MLRSITLLKEIKEDLNKQGTIACSWIRRLNTLRYPSHQFIYRFDAIQIKIAARFFEHIGELILKCI